MRKFYEKLNLHVYIIVPFVFVLLHYTLVYAAKINIFDNQSFSENSFEFVLTMLGVLLTILGLMFTLPDNKYRELMKRYNHDRIIYNSIFIGILSSMVFVFLYFIDISTFIQELMYVTVFSEVAISTWWIFRTLVVINQ